MEIKISGRFLDFRADYVDEDSDIINELEEEEIEYCDICGFACFAGADLKADESVIMISDKAFEFSELTKIRIIKDISATDFFSEEQIKIVKDYRKSTVGEYQKERRRYFSGGTGDLVEIIAYCKGEALFGMEMNSPFIKENLFIMSMDLLGFDDIELLHSFGYKENDGSITWSETGVCGDSNIRGIDIFINGSLI